MYTTEVKILYKNAKRPNTTKAKEVNLEQWPLIIVLKLCMNRYLLSYFFFLDSLTRHFVSTYALIY